MVLLAILAKRFEILAVYAVLESSLIDKDNHVGVFVPITIITAHDYFFNYTFKNVAVKSVQNLVRGVGIAVHNIIKQSGNVSFPPKKEKSSARRARALTKERLSGLL